MVDRKVEPNGAAEREAREQAAPLVRETIRSVLNKLREREERLEKLERDRQRIAAAVNDLQAVSADYLGGLEKVADPALLAVLSALVMPPNLDREALSSAERVGPPSGGSDREGLDAPDRVAELPSEVAVVSAAKQQERLPGHVGEGPLEVQGEVGNGPPTGVLRDDAANQAVTPSRRVVVGTPVRTAENLARRDQLVRELGAVPDIETARKLQRELKDVLMDRSERVVCPECGKPGALQVRPAGSRNTQTGRLMSVQFVVRHSQLGKERVEHGRWRNVPQNIGFQ